MAAAAHGFLRGWAFRNQRMAALEREALVKGGLAASGGPAGPADRLQGQAIAALRRHRSDTTLRPSGPGASDTTPP
jgi:hypothetical protein